MAHQGHLFVFTLVLIKAAAVEVQSPLNNFFGFEILSFLILLSNWGQEMFFGYFDETLNFTKDSHQHFSKTPRPNVSE